MELTTGALPNLIPKLRELIADEFNLQEGVKGEIRSLVNKLESLKADLEYISSRRPIDVNIVDKLWAIDVREMSYYFEDKIDALMVPGKGSTHVSKMYIDRSLNLLTQNKIRQLAIDIRNVNGLLESSRSQYDRYRVDGVVSCSNVTVDPRIYYHLGTKATELIGIDEARDKLIQSMMEGNEVSKQQVKIVSIVGFAGLGKTTLANVVYENLRAQFDCSGFVFVCQNPNMTALFKSIFYQFGGERAIGELLDIGQLISQIRYLLRDKRYFIVVDDIWDISVWNLIRCALPDDNNGSKIITTTRSFKLAEQVGGAYRLKPLSLHKSRILFFSRVFDKHESPDEKLAEASDRILKKCGGLPLAINTAARLFADRSFVNNWNELYHKVGSFGVQNREMDNTRMVLSLSYYDLPYHLRVCLLYLSVFPEDHKIEKNRLIWMWIAEGFIHCENEKSLFELGESYFYELIDRSLIQLEYNGYDDIIGYCHVHVLMLDLIRSLSSELNFVTIFDDLDTNHKEDQSVTRADANHASRIARKVSLQTNKEDQSVTWADARVHQVRSAVFFSSTHSLVLALPSFRVLRVLDVQGCFLSRGCDLKYLGTLLHLRYLGLRGTGIAELPEEVGNLQFLEILDVTCNEISKLPMTVENLRSLKCLRIDVTTRVPNVFASLASLEELSGICIYDSTDIKVLGCLTELRVLDISFHIDRMDYLEKYIVESIRKLKLQKIQTLCIWVTSGECKADAWVIPGHICKLNLRGCWFSKLPAWVDPSLLLKLSIISIAIIKLQQEHLKILGMLPVLRYLNLKVDHENLSIQERFNVGAYFFPCLVRCTFWGFRGPVVFQQGAMPKLTSHRFTLHVRDMREIAGSSDGVVDMGLRNLRSLQHVTVFLRGGGVSEEEVVEAKAALRHASKIHPNPLTIDIMG